ncbi:MAG: sulfotransferase [Bacteroidales bacterium]|nr:sulfotransferase [Bacteroidales bacterium]MBN2698920.1 sulfotransferase [Bacteroidales bacterium]
MLSNYKRPILPLLIYAGKRIEAQRFSDSPILVGGCARSGTTLLLSILSSHRELFCIPKELGLFNEVSKDEQGNSEPLRIDRLYTSLLVNRIPKQAKRWCEKSPSNIHHIQDIDSYFGGNFRFLQIIRDGRDVVLSRHPVARDTYWVSPERWVLDVSTGMKYTDHPNVYTLKYENLVQDFKKSVEGICSFLGIPVSEEILNWHKHAAVTRNRAYYSRVKELSGDSIGKWKQPQNQERIAAFMNNPEAVRLLECLGYKSHE